MMSPKSWSKTRISVILPLAVALSSLAGTSQAASQDTDLFKWMTTHLQSSERKKIDGLPTNPTTVSVKNDTQSQAYFYINLTPPSQTTPSYPKAEEISDLSNVSSMVTGPNTSSGEGTITKINSLNGYFFLNAGDTVSFATTPNNGTFSAQIFTNGTNPSMSSFPCDQQCVGGVDSRGKPLKRQGRGATFAEFTINCDPDYLLPDTVDISEVNGVNALYKVTLPPISKHASSTHYPQFFCCSSYLFTKRTLTQWGTFASGQYIPVPSIANNPGPLFPFIGDGNGKLYPISPAKSAGSRRSYSRGTVGVYPFGCDQCVRIVKPGCGTKSDYGATRPQYHQICQISRPVPNIGGNINVELRTFPYPPVSSQDMYRGNSGR